MESVKSINKSASSSGHTTEQKPVYDFFKRIFDIICSSAALIILSPVFLILTVAIKTTDKGPVFFTHRRVGKGGKPLNIYKFRSMVTEYERNFKLEDDPRVTKVGKFMRRTSLDELPQLFNILKGDISIVGPRPVMEVETEIYGNYRDMLLSVKPGLTGFWAANGRSCTTYTRRRAMEICYIKNRSVCFDLKIILKTITSVFKGEGAV